MILNPEKGSIWRHFKGQIYEVLDVAVDCNPQSDSEDVKWQVIYIRRGYSKIVYARSVESWFEEVDGRPRFEKLSDLVTLAEFLSCKVSDINFGFVFNKMIEKGYEPRIIKENEKIFTIGWIDHHSQTCVLECIEYIFIKLAAKIAKDNLS